METRFQPPATHLSANQPDCPSSSSSSPYFVRPVAKAKTPVPEEIKVPQEQPLPQIIPPAPTVQDKIMNYNPEDKRETLYETSTVEPEEADIVPGGGGVPTVGGETNMQRHVMLPLAEAVAAGALRRSARQKKRGIAYFTFRKGREETVSDLEVITEDQLGRHSPVSTENTEGHWSAPETRVIAKRPKVPPKPPPRPDKTPIQQNVVIPAPVLTTKVFHEEPAAVKPVTVKPILFAGPPKTPSTLVDNDPISMSNAALQLEKQFAHIARRSPPVMSPPEPDPIPAPEVTEKDVTDEKESKPKEKKSKNSHKKKKKKEEEKKRKKNEEKEKKEKKEKKKEKKKKKKKDKVKSKTSKSGDNKSPEKKESPAEDDKPQENPTTNAKPVSKKVAIKIPRKRLPSLVNEDCQSGSDVKRDTDEQGHLTVIQVVNAGAESQENDDASEDARLKNESGFTRLSRKISHRVGTWGKDFKRLLSFRREKPQEDNSSDAEDDDPENENVAVEPEETELPVPTKTASPNQMNIAGAYLPPQTQPKVPLLPPKCTPVPVPVPPPHINPNKSDEDCLNFCDEGKTNQIIYWLQNVYSNQNIDEHLAMITATTVATQF